MYITYLLVGTGGGIIITSGRVSFLSFKNSSRAMHCVQDHRPSGIIRSPTEAPAGHHAHHRSSPGRPSSSSPAHHQLYACCGAGRQGRQGLPAPLFMLLMTVVRRPDQRMYMPVHAADAMIAASKRVNRLIPYITPLLLPTCQASPSTYNTITSSLTSSGRR